jgi:hypothetical protein
MSRNRFDRKQAPEQWKSDYVPLGGGIDLASSALNIKPGRLVASLNVEEVFGQQGYSFTAGYERFDGRSRPSAATYAIQPFDAGGPTAIVAGNTVTNATTATALVVSVTLTSGSWAGSNAAGYLLLTAVTDSWADNDPIRVGGVLRATASDITEPGSVGYENHQAALTAVREYLRALIQPVPGAGPVLGVAVFNGAVYAVRQQADDTASLYKSSAAGWVLIRAGLHGQYGEEFNGGGIWRFEVANFTGDPTDQSLYGVNGQSRMIAVDRDDVVTFAEPIFGSEATSISSVTIGLGAKSFTIVDSARSWLVGTILRVSSIADAGDYMVGAVTAYNSGTGVVGINVTEIGGAGTLASWEFALATFEDRPYLLTEHKDHMFWGYQYGQMQTSNLGDPMAATTTAALFGVGDELTNLVSLKGEMLAAICRDKINMLRGSTALDWELGTHAKETGADLDTAIDNSGNAIFLDDKGLSCMQGTLNFGDFEASIFSRDVKKTIDAKRSLVVGARMAKNNYQYRLYFSDKTCMRFTLLSGNAVLTPKDVSPTTSAYLHDTLCFGSGKLAAGESERMFFGTSDGYVMEEDAGTSHDGAAIFYAMLLPFNHYKSPAYDKQFHKGELELTCPDAVDFSFRTTFDYDDGLFSFGDGSASLPGQGGAYDIDAFDTFQYDKPRNSRAEYNLDGQGRNMAFLVWAESDFVRPATLQGVLTYYSLLGIRR